MIKINELSIDLETFCILDIKKCGLYKYIEHPSFEILLMSISINGGDVVVYDIKNGDVVPEEILLAICSDRVIKWAFNAGFERIALSKWILQNYPEYFRGYGFVDDTIGDFLDPYSWRCSLIWSAYLGLPLSLEAVGAVLKLTHRKMTEGKELINYFCRPCKPTKSNGGN